MLVAYPCNIIFTLDVNYFTYTQHKSQFNLNSDLYMVSCQKIQ